MYRNVTTNPEALHLHSVEEISELLDLSAASVRNKLAGRRRWQVSELKKLADEWGTTVDALLDGSDSR